MAERVLIGVRTSTETQSALVAAAGQQRISVNRLINDRLTASLDDDRNVDLVFASRALFGLMKVVAAAMEAAGTAALHLDTGSSENLSRWHTNGYAYGQATSAAIAVLEACRPPGNRKPSHSVDVAMNSLKLRIGQVSAETILAEIADSKAAGRGERLRRDLAQTVIDTIRNRTGGKK